MKAIRIFFNIFFMSLFLLFGCKENGVDDIIPVYLEDFTEYTPSKPYTSEDIKVSIEKYGLTELAALVKYNIKVYKIKYKTAFEGDSITASGLLAVPVPEKNSNTFSLLSYQHPTMTAKTEAPTSNPLGEVSAMATYMASAGFVVMIPDYVGFGSSSDKFHSYMIKEYTVNAVLDFIRATKEFIATEKPCKINDKLFLSGYSQGGAATLGALSAIENSSANNDLKVTASACGAGIYNLNDFRDWMVSQTKYDQPYLMAYLLESFRQYEGLEIDDSLVYSKKFAALIPGMFDGVKTVEQTNAMFSTLDVGELFDDNFEQDTTIFNKDDRYADLRLALRKNSVPVWNLNSEVRLYYGKSDMWVPSEQALKIYSEFRNKGVTTNIKIDAIDGLDHNGATIPTLARSVVWFSKL